MPSPKNPAVAFPTSPAPLSSNPGPEPPTAPLAPSHTTRRHATEICLERTTSSAPEGASAEDIEYRAECLRKADMHRLALASVKARHARQAVEPREVA